MNRFLRLVPLGPSRRWAFLLLLAAFAMPACGGSTPGTPTPSPTRTIALAGNLTLGDVLVGSPATGSFIITNNGNTALSVTGLSLPTGLSANWTTGTIGPNASQTVTVTFNPASPGSYSGTITVNGDQTSGTNTIAYSATAYANLKGDWSGTQAGTDTSTVCSHGWTITVQSGSQFSGTWRQTGAASCLQGGTVSGAISIANAITGLSLVVSGSFTPPCTRVSGDGLFSGTLSGNAITAQMTERVRCGSAPETNRTTTLNVTRQ